MSLFEVPSIPTSEATHLDTDALGNAQNNNSGATMNGIPSLPSHSTVGPSGGSEPPSLSPSEEPPSSGSDPIESSETILSWADDIGPHNRCDITGSLFGEIGSFRPVMKLRNAQWFLKELMVKHESSAHRLLAVSFYFSYYSPI